MTARPSAAPLAQAYYMLLQPCVRPLQVITRSGRSASSLAQGHRSRTPGCSRRPARGPQWALCPAHPVHPVQCTQCSASSAPVSASFRGSGTCASASMDSMSRWLVGSSKSSRCGRAMARPAKTARAFCPPDRSLPGRQDVRQGGGGGDISGYLSAHMRTRRRWRDGEGD